MSLSPNGKYVLIEFGKRKGWLPVNSEMGKQALAKLKEAEEAQKAATKQTRTRKKAAEKAAE